MHTHSTCKVPHDSELKVKGFSIEYAWSESYAVVTNSKFIHVRAYDPFPADSPCFDCARLLMQRKRDDFVHEAEKEAS